MNRFYKCLIGIVLSLSMTVVGYSQKSPSNFGKISEELLSAEYCPIDSSAHAYYVFDYGFSYFQYATTKVREGESTQNQKGFQLFFKRQFRIKILDNEGFEWADVAIPLYRDGDEEKIGTIKATTYNLVDGKIEKIKLDRKDIFTEETSDYWIQKKFAMPGVKEGSVIEVEYTIISDFFFNLREWAFQSSIPVLRSEYIVHIPEYYIFNQTQRGYYPIEIESGVQQKQISISYSYDTNNKVQSRQTSTSTTKYKDNTYSYLAEDVPAFPLEDYLRTEDNYISKIEFELQRTNYPNSPDRYYTTTWDQVDKTLIRSSSFGEAMSKSSHLSNDASTLKSSGEEGLSLVKLAFNQTKNKLSWNGNIGKYTSKSLSKTYQDGGGNCADINLNLVALLMELGFESYPVVLSTQKNGIIHPSHPSLSRFNYVIAMVRLEGNTYLLDATDPYAEINLLPIMCLNDKGRVIGCNDMEWINLMDFRPYEYASIYALTLNENLTITGSRKMELKDYASYQYKKRIKDFDDLDKFEKSFAEQHPDIKIENIRVEGLDSMDSQLTLSYEFSQDDFVEDASDIIYFSPVIEPFFESNPFKLEKREYPVEFNYPYSIRESIYISLPEGYAVSELPKALLIKMPDNSAQYTFQAVKSGDDLIINTGFSIRKSQFLPEEYEGIKQFYQMVIDKQNELVVLNKS
jgi:hypothetical protein